MEAFGRRFIRSMRTVEQKSFFTHTRILGTSLVRAAKGRGVRNLLVKVVLDPYFPVTFLLRNIAALSGEHPFSSLSARSRREFLRRIILQRAVMFLHVKGWIREKGAWESLEAGIASLEENPSDSYCNHCGRCCEIASGFPDFPPQSGEVPREWLRIFGDGLGKGHRFCAFLWETKGSGRSFCSIHPWRSNPCRIFEEEECEYLKKDPDFPGPSTRVELNGAYRSLLRLLNSR